jgi:hypothetical protein
MAYQSSAVCVSTLARQAALVANRMNKETQRSTVKNPLF